MIRNFIGNVLELFLMLELLALSYKSYLFVYNINIFPAIEVNIAYYLFSQNSQKKAYIYLILFDLVLDQMIFTNILSYLASIAFMQITLNKDNNSDLSRFIHVVILTFIFLTTRYIIVSAYELRFFNYIDILCQVITTSLSYPVAESIFRMIEKVRVK